MPELTRTAGAFVCIRPRSVAPVVLTCEHASNRLPFRRRVTAAERRILGSHWGWDIGAWGLTRELARRLGTTAIGGRWSRLLVDLNRRVDDPTVVRRRAAAVDLSWNSGLEAAEIERRLIAYHTPYHAEVDRLILRCLVRGVRPLLFAVHTFTPVYDGRERPFEIGVLYEEHRREAHRLGRLLRASGLDVRYNQPYSGVAGMMYSVDRHGKHHRLPCLELEVNHAMFDRRSTTSRLGGVVATAIRELVSEL